jgi:hypothetical protein
MVTTTYAIIKITRETLRSWDGQVTYNLHELKLRGQENDLVLLATKEVMRLFHGQSDPVVGEAITNWEQKESEAPASPAWERFARELLLTAFAELEIPENGWRDRTNSWVGRIYTNTTSANKAALCVFNNSPSTNEINSRIGSLVAEEGLSASDYIFIVYDGNDTRVGESLSIQNLNVQIWSRRSLLRKGLKLWTYARDLLRRYDEDVLGGTGKTLSDTFVDAHVTSDGNDKDRILLSDVLEEWVKDVSRRQLVITGDYGQGKSTAMLRYCVDWARRYIAGTADSERIPLLIELRGHCPSEVEPLIFISGWAGRFGLVAKELMNLIQAGDAILIFEGFDELRNAGREFHRHENLNALWKFAYPGTKIIFTGRPNFFSSEAERNRTLRSNLDEGAAGKPFSKVYKLSKLTPVEVAKSAFGFGADIGQSIINATNNNPQFFDIVSRPSMLPVVATIWPEIEQLQAQGYNVDSALLLERYIQATYSRKDAELEAFIIQTQAAGGFSYINLPYQVRDLFSIIIAWQMARLCAQNSIERSKFDRFIVEKYEDVLRCCMAKGVQLEIVEKVKVYIEKTKDEPAANTVETISHEVASAGLFVVDPAGGPSNLGFSHKQFYEYYIAKAAWFIIAFENSLASKLMWLNLRDAVASDVFTVMNREPESRKFLCQMIDGKFGVFDGVYFRFVVLINSLSAMIAGYISYLNFYAKSIAKRFGIPHPENHAYEILEAGYTRRMQMVVEVVVVLIGFGASTSYGSALGVFSCLAVVILYLPGIVVYREKLSLFESLAGMYYKKDTWKVSVLQRIALLRRGQHDHFGKGDLRPLA